MFKWLHHLLNPHCPDCQLAAAESNVCQSCETVKMQLAMVNAEKRQLLDTIMTLTRPAETQPAPPQVKMENTSSRMLWGVRKQMLEAEDRKKAELLAKQRKTKQTVAQTTSTVIPTSAEDEDRARSINNLEKELGIEEKTSA